MTNRKPKLTDEEKDIFTSLVANGESKTKAYLAVRPEVSTKSAGVLGSNLSKQPDIKERLRGQRLNVAEEIFELSTSAMRKALTRTHTKLDKDEELSAADTKVLALAQSLVVDAVGKEMEDTTGNAAAQLLTAEVIAALHAQGAAAIEAAKADVAIDITPIYDESEIKEALEDKD